MKRYDTVYNCPLVHPWKLDQETLNKHEKLVHYAEEHEEDANQDYKWRKAAHRNRQGAELDRVQKDTKGFERALPELQSAQIGSR